MEGDLVFYFVAFGLDLGYWLLTVAVVGMTFFREEKERDKDDELERERTRHQEIELRR